MRRKKESTLDLVARAPWWVGVSLAVGFFAALRLVVPAVAPQASIVRAATPQFAWLALAFLLPAGVSAVNSLRKRVRLDRQTGIESIRSLPWKEFEELLSEAYRRQGYVVQENTSRGPDGGVDLTIQHGGNRYLVQCKQWRSTKVGVKVVREMYGLLVAERAAGAIIVTSGVFTQEATAFAAGKPVDLVGGYELTRLIQSVQTGPAMARVPEARPVVSHCPRCGGQLVLREARRGPRAESKFWGCSGYPGCRYTRDHGQ